MYISLEQSQKFEHIYLAILPLKTKVMRPHAFSHLFAMKFLLVSNLDRCPKVKKFAFLFYEIMAPKTDEELQDPYFIQCYS